MTQEKTCCRTVDTQFLGAWEFKSCVDAFDANCRNPSRESNYLEIPLSAFTDTSSLDCEKLSFPQLLVGTDWHSKGHEVEPSLCVEKPCKRTWRKLPQSLKRSTCFIMLSNSSVNFLLLERQEKNREQHRINGLRGSSIPVSHESFFFSKTHTLVM